MSEKIDFKSGKENGICRETQLVPVVPSPTAEAGNQVGSIDDDDDDYFLTMVFKRRIVDDLIAAVFHS